MKIAPGVWSFEGVVPVVDPSAYVHPSAVLLGDVWVGAGCYVGPGAVLRGDFGRIEMRRESNLQDNCIVHSHPAFDCVIDVRGHVGHGAVVHCAHIGPDALVGMNAVVLDFAQVGEQAIIGAMSLVKIRGVVPPRVLWTGVPGRVARELGPAELAGKKEATDLYVELAQRCLAGVAPAQALAAPEAGRARTRWAFEGSPGSGR